MEIISYLFFGGATTLVNIVVYFFFREVAHIGFATSNTIAWVLSVLFAFVTNKKWVFKTKSETATDWLREAGVFLVYRGFSYLIDMAIMYLLLEWLGISDFISKMATQIIVILLNYLFSKWFIFKK